MGKKKGQEEFITLNRILNDIIAVKKEQYKNIYLERNIQPDLEYIEEVMSIEDNLNVLRKELQLVVEKYPKYCEKHGVTCNIERVASRSYQFDEETASKIKDYYLYGKEYSTLSSAMLDIIITLKIRYSKPVKREYLEGLLNVYLDLKKIDMASLLHGKKKYLTTVDIKDFTKFVVEILHMPAEESEKIRDASKKDDPLKDYFDEHFKNITLNSVASKFVLETLYLNFNEDMNKDLVCDNFIERHREYFVNPKDIDRNFIEVSLGITIKQVCAPRD